MSRIHFRKLAISLIALISLVGLPDLNSVTQKINSELLVSANAAASKVTICHRTRSTTNPYRRITVAKSAVAGSGSTHQRHEASPTDRIWDSSYPNGGQWGDIIPDTAADGTSVNDKLWTGAGNGQNIWNGITTVPSTGKAACRSMTPKQFFDAEIAAYPNDTATIIADLNDQEANEDKALKAALGGSGFTSSNLSTWSTALGVTTDNPTNVDSTTATLNGTVKGSTSTSGSIRWQFEYNTSPTLDSPTVLTSLSGSGVTTTAAQNTNISGLTKNTTYYYRIVGVTDFGLDTEGYLYGEIKQFTTPNVSARPQTIQFSLSGVPTKKYGDPAFQIQARPIWTGNTDTTTLQITFTSSTTSKCTVGSNTNSANAETSTVMLTIVGAGTCTIVASQGGGTNSAGIAYLAAVDVSQSITINTAELTVTSVDRSKNQGDADPTFAVTTSTLVGSDAVSGATHTFAGKPGTTFSSSTTPPTLQGVYYDTPSVIVFSTGNASDYTITYVAGTYTINAASSGGSGGSGGGSSAPAKPAGPKFKLKDPAPNNPANNQNPTPGATPTPTPIKKPVAPPAITNPLPKETVPLLTNENTEAKIEEVKSNSPVKSKVDEKGNIELIVPIGFKGQVELEVKDQPGGAAEKIVVPVEGPKPTVEPKEQYKELPRVSPEKPGQVNVIGGNNKVTVSWSKSEAAAAYDIYSENKLVCTTVYTACTVPAENNVTKQYQVVPVSNKGTTGAAINGSGKALASGTLLAIVYFNTDKFNIRPDARATLNKLINDLYALGLRDVSLSGHTDTQAPTAYNDRLSTNRSKTVEAFLARSVIDAYIAKDAFSEKVLAVKTRDEVNQQLNRRVEIRVK